MSEFDEQEYHRYVTATDEQVDDARTLAEHGSDNSAVLHCTSSRPRRWR